MAAKSGAGVSEAFWHEYNIAYVRSVGVPDDDVELAAMVLGRGAATPTPGAGRSPRAWRRSRALHAADVPMGVVSNASGQIEEVLARQRCVPGGGGAAHSGAGDHRQPSRGCRQARPAIFDFALVHFPGIDRHRIAYVGDSVTMDVGGARAAGLHPILLDPHDDHPDADFDRIISLLELLPPPAEPRLSESAS